MKKLLLLIGLSLFSVSSFAAESKGVKFGLSFFKYDTATEGPNLGDNTSSISIYDIKLGYLSDSLYLGVIYDQKTIDSSGTDQRTAYGVTVGYHNDGWFLDGSYFISAERDLGATVLKDGKGYALDVGYNHMMGSNVFVGLQASYKSFTYNKVGGASVTNKEKSELYPMLNLGIMF